MEGKKDEGIRKGPWKAEEDQVLINHVNKYGPRDWSSIRSKGLLQRTGKSCRLRWVNKLRPNLKNGCKFSLEEERVVIELQAQFGNKWARIATYLPGRTDNDVKNFWSSRQKRLAKILQTTPSSSSSSKSHKNKREAPLNHEVPTLEASTFNSSSEGESSKLLPESSSNAVKMVPLPDLVNQELLIFNPDLFQPEFCPPLENLHMDSQPLTPFPQPPQHQPDFTFSSENQDLMDPYFDMFGSLDASKVGYGTQLPFGQPFLEPVESFGRDGKENLDNCSTPDCFFDDFPTDMFDDQIDSLPSPSDH